MRLTVKYLLLSFFIVMIFKYSAGMSRAEIFERAYSFLQTNELETLKDYLDVMQLDIDKLTSDEQIELNYLFGIYYFRAGNYSQAIEYFRKSTPNFPSESNYYLNRCYLYTKQEIAQVEVKPDIFSLIELPAKKSDDGEIDVLRLLKRDYIRVLIKTTEKAVIDAPANSKIYDETNNILKTVSERAQFTVKYNSQNTFNFSKLGKNSFLRIEPDKQLSIDNTVYKYPVEIKVNDRNKNIFFILEIPLEDYIKCVVPVEISHSWPREMLKAQSIAARTYAVYHMLASERMPYDVKSDQSSQVFGSSAARRKNTDEAVDATRNIIMTSAGRPIAAFFYADSGGFTEEPHIIWGGRKFSYFKSEIDEYARPAAQSKWKYSAKERDLRRAVAAVSSKKINKINKIYPTRTTANGRWLELAVEHSGEVTNVDAYRLRIALGSQFLFKSLLITDFYKDDDSFVFEGLGFGHGVGMPQWSGRRMAELNFSYADILKNYYKGIDFARLAFD